MKEILLVDDEIDIQIIVADFLRNHGMRVEAYANGQQANERLKERSYDLIITDLKMPTEDGTSLVYKARKYWKDSHRTPIIIISGAAKLDDFEFSYNDLDKHNIQFLEKPFDLDDVLKMVCTAFGVDVSDVGSLISI